MVTRTEKDGLGLRSSQWIAMGTERAMDIGQGSQFLLP